MRKSQRETSFLEEAGARLSLSQEFHQYTCLTELIRDSDSSGWPEEWKTIYFKAYPRLPAFRLPQPRLPRRLSLLDAFNQRRSARAFAPTPSKLRDLGAVLYYAAGIRSDAATQVGARFYPSAGARYPLEVYPVVFNVEGLHPGVYHYYPKEHALETLWENPTIGKEVFPCLSASWMEDAAAALVVTAVFSRNQMKYGERGYRHVLVEAGHLGQNISLLCGSLRLACCSVGGFIDEAWNDVLDIDGIQESVISILCIGQAPASDVAEEKKAPVR